MCVWTHANRTLICIMQDLSTICCLNYANNLPAAHAVSSMFFSGPDFFDWGPGTDF